MIKVLSSWLKKAKQLRQSGLLFSVEHLFLLLYIPIGLLFLFTIPLGQNPDFVFQPASQSIHFSTSFQIKS